MTTPAAITHDGMRRMLAHLLPGSPETMKIVEAYIAQAAVHEALLVEKITLLRNLAYRCNNVPFQELPEAITTMKLELDEAREKSEKMLRHLIALAQGDGGQGQAGVKAEDLVAVLSGTIATLIAERDEARAGYHALDKNWEAHHEACMKPIRQALSLPHGTVPELYQAIRRRTPGRELVKAVEAWRNRVYGQHDERIGAEEQALADAWEVFEAIELAKAWSVFAEPETAPKNTDGN